MRPGKVILPGLCQHRILREISTCWRQPLRGSEQVCARPRQQLFDQLG
jgi:hypothetical protein